MGCGCGKKFSSPATAASRAAITPSSSVPPQVQAALYAQRNATVAQSQATPYRNGKTIQRKVV